MKNFGFHVGLQRPKKVRSWDVFRRFSVPSQFWYLGMIFAKRYGSRNELSNTLMENPQKGQRTNKPTKSNTTNKVQKRPKTKILRTKPPKKTGHLQKTYYLDSPKRTKKKKTRKQTKKTHQIFPKKLRPYLVGGPRLQPKITHFFACKLIV